MRGDPEPDPPGGSEGDTPAPDGLDAAPLGAEPTGAEADQLDEQPLAAGDEREVAAAVPTAPAAPTRPAPRGERGQPAHEVPRSHRRAAHGSRVGHIREPELANFWRSWLGQAIALLFGVLVLGTAFIASYVGALHNPKPRDLPVAVVAGDTQAQALLAGVATQAGPVLQARQYASAAQAGDALARRRVYAVLSTDGSTTAGGLNLTLAGAAAPGAAEVITQAVTSAAGTAQIPLAVEDAHPLTTGDPRGLTAFYTVVGLMVGGYLAATALAIALGTVPRDLDRLGLRLAGFGVFALALGLVAAILVGPVYDIWNRHFLGVWLTGALIAFVGAVVAAALQAWLGLVGTGLALLLLFIVGNPGSGGVFAPQFLPGPYGSVHLWNPTGLAADLLRGVVYFDRHAIVWPLTGLVIWGVAAILGVLGATAALGRRVQASR